MKMLFELPGELEVDIVNISSETEEDMDQLP